MTTRSRLSREHEADRMRKKRRSGCAKYEGGCCAGLSRARQFVTAWPWLESAAIGASVCLRGSTRGASVQPRIPEVCQSGSPAASGCAAWYRLCIMASRQNDTKSHTMKKSCFQVLGHASECQVKTKKSPCKHGLSYVFMPADASLCQTRNHSHSIVNLGLEPFGDGVSAWSCGVDTVSDTEKHAGS